MGPIDSLRFVHTAIERELDDLERLVSSAQAPGEAAKLRDRFEFLERLSDGHTRGEEVGMFPDLDAKLPGFSKTFLFDHEDEHAAFARIKAELVGCASDDASALARLDRDVTRLADHVTRHIRKENELVLPLVHEHFSVAEQAGMVGRIVSLFTPADMASVVPFIVAWLDPEDRARYVTVLSKAVPEPGFRALAGRIRERLDAPGWAALAQAVPALA